MVYSQTLVWLGSFYGELALVTILSILTHYFFRFSSIPPTHRFGLEFLHVLREKVRLLAQLQALPCTLSCITVQLVIYVSLTLRICRSCSTSCLFNNGNPAQSIVWSISWYAGRMGCRYLCIPQSARLHTEYRLFCRYSFVCRPLFHYTDTFFILLLGCLRCKSQIC